MSPKTRRIRTQPRAITMVPSARQTHRGHVTIGRPSSLTSPLLITPTPAPESSRTTICPAPTPNSIRGNVGAALWQTVLGRGGRNDMQRLFNRIGTSASRQVTPTSPDVTSREMAAVLHGLAVENEVAAASSLTSMLSGGTTAWTRSGERAGSVAVGGFDCAGRICVRLPGVVSFPRRELLSALSWDLLRLPR